MKRKAFPVLALAATLASTAACTATVADPEPIADPVAAPASLDALSQELAETTLADAMERAAHFRPLCDASGYPLVGNINAKGTTVSAFCAAVREREPATKPAPTCDRKALNAELSESTMLEEAIENRAHFRCLCDADGYPLVGNINAKGTTASKFCQTLRERSLQ